MTTRESASSGVTLFLNRLFMAMAFGYILMAVISILSAPSEKEQQRSADQWRLVDETFVPLIAATHQSPTAAQHSLALWMDDLRSQGQVKLTAVSGGTQVQWTGMAQSGCDRLAALGKAYPSLAKQVELRQDGLLVDLSKGNLWTCRGITHRVPTVFTWTPSPATFR